MSLPFLQPDLLNSYKMAGVSQTPLCSLLALVLTWTTLGHAARLPASIKAHDQAIKTHNMLNDRPIIGILSQPGDPAPDGYSYIAASYVKWIESAGARVVPIFYDMTPAEIRDRFSVINGLLLPGGGAKLSRGHQFYDTAELLFDLAIEANNNGDYFPIHGTCLGMETLSVIASQNYTILTEFDAEDAAAALLYTEDAHQSHFIKSLPEDVQQALQMTPIAMENHRKGVSMASYKENRALEDFFKVLSLSLDKSGNTYISTLEARKYPIVATQIRMAQEVANFFVSEARKNMHKPRNQIEEDDLVIYNYEPHFTGRHVTEGEERDFDQAYFFRASASGKPDHH